MSSSIQHLTLNISKKKNKKKNIDFTEKRCGVTGNWLNQHGSCVKFTYCLNGELTGQYKSRVGEASGSYYLSGRYTIVGPNHLDIVLGFSVAWNNMVFGNSNSTTSWTGIYNDSTDKIYTTWLLTKYTTLADKWSNTLVDQDVFERVYTC